MDLNVMRCISTGGGKGRGTNIALQTALIWNVAYQNEATVQDNHREGGERETDCRRTVNPNKTTVRVQGVFLSQIQRPQPTTLACGEGGEKERKKKRDDHRASGCCFFARRCCRWQSSETRSECCAQRYKRGEVPTPNCPIYTFQHLADRTKVVFFPSTSWTLMKKTNTAHLCTPIGLIRSELISHSDGIAC